MGVSEVLEPPPEYFPLLQSAGDPGSTDPVQGQQAADPTGSRDTTEDRTLSTLTTSQCQVNVISSLSCPVKLDNKLTSITSSIALLRSQVLGSLPEHESLKLRSIWVLGSKNSALNGSHVFMLFS